MILVEQQADRVQKATDPLAQLVVTSGVARIWCNGGTTIEAPKPPNGVGYGDWLVGVEFNAPLDTV